MGHILDFVVEVYYLLIVKSSFLNILFLLLIAKEHFGGKVFNILALTPTL
jgi:hypothetical protein